MSVSPSTARGHTLRVMWMRCNVLWFPSSNKLSKMFTLRDPVQPDTVHTLLLSFLQSFFFHCRVPSVLQCAVVCSAVLVWFCSKCCYNCTCSFWAVTPWLHFFYISDIWVHFAHNTWSYFHFFTCLLSYFYFSKFLNAGLLLVVEYFHSVYFYWGKTCEYFLHHWFKLISKSHFLSEYWSE